MMELVVRPRARGDLAEIWLCTADRWGIDQADTYLARIDQDMARSLLFPEAGSLLPGLSTDYRKIISGSHRVIYCRTPTALIVVRVIHEREDLPSEMGELE